MRNDQRTCVEGHSPIPSIPRAFLRHEGNPQAMKRLNSFSRAELAVVLLQSNVAGTKLSGHSSTSIGAVFTPLGKAILLLSDVLIPKVVNNVCYCVPRYYHSTPGLYHARIAPPPE
jgi:hypothetical protein